MNKILTFDGEYRWLSNFWQCIVYLDGVLYPSVEHAYQAAKTRCKTTREAIRAIPADRAGKAKRAGKDLERTPEGDPHWKLNRLTVMEDLINQKYSMLNPDLQRKLIETGNAIIEEGNNWGDTFWGVYPPGSDNGQNRLGLMIMQRRLELTHGKIWR